MGNVPFTIEEENLICIFHKLHNITDAAFEETQFTMTLSDAE